MMKDRATVFAVAFLSCFALWAALRTAAVYGAETPRAVTLVVTVCLVALGIALLLNSARVRPVHAWGVPMTAYAVAVFTEFMLLVLARGRYITGPPHWIAPALAILLLASGIYGLVTIARFRR